MIETVYGDYVPLSFKKGVSPTSIASAYPVPSDDLFDSVAEYVRKLLVGEATNERTEFTVSHHSAFTLANGTALSAHLDSVRPSHVQCLLSLLYRESMVGAGSPLRGHHLDARARLTLWTRAGDDMVARFKDAWMEITAAGDLDPLVAMTTPSLYGNKLRLVPFIAPVAFISLPAGVPVLDLMAGTGVMGRVLSNRHPVFANDPNPYAALLSGTQRFGPSERSSAEIIAALRPAFLSNCVALTRLIRASVDEESAYLHGEADADALERYCRFLTAPVLAQTGCGTQGVASLVTERYANVYFGVEQSVEIDSLRCAIDVAFRAQSVERDLCLSALLLACTTCATGPHFAQPIQPKTPKGLRTMIERRARSISWEFDLALGRLSARSAPKHEIAQATSLDWRKALVEFANKYRGTKAGVYLDPPYTKLQYSRYYHVLNVLLAYDYPEVSGSGRYPPRTSRFSSRFEFQPGVARRELADLIEMCASYGLTTLLSYSDTGFVSIDALQATMGTNFNRVDVFSEQTRHHPQGRALAGNRRIVREKVLVGHP